jgi:ABC-2 type transport system permease protein
VIVGVFTGVFFPENQKDRRTAGQVAKVFKKALDEEMILDVVTPAGFFNVAFQHPLTFLAVIFAGAVPLMALPSGDRGRGTLDLLLATPLSRARLVATAFSAGAFGAILVAWAPSLGVALGARFANVADSVPIDAFVKTSVNLDRARPVVRRRWRRSCRVASEDGPTAMRRFGACIFIAFALQVAGQLWKGNTWIRALGPIGWYRPALVTAGKGTPLLDAAVLVVVGAALLAVALSVARRRRRA